MKFSNTPPKVGSPADTGIICVHEIGYYPAINNTMIASAYLVKPDSSQTHQLLICKDRMILRTFVPGNFEAGYSDGKFPDSCRTSSEGFDQANRPYYLTVLEAIASEKRDIALTYEAKRLDTAESDAGLWVWGVVLGINVSSHSAYCK